MVNYRKFRRVTELTSIDLIFLFGNMPGYYKAKSGKEKKKC